MGKRILTLYAEDGDVELAKSRGIVLSSFFRECLHLEITKENTDNLSEKQQIIILNNKIALLSVELNNKNNELEALKKSNNKQKKERIIDLGVVL